MTELAKVGRIVENDALIAKIYRNDNVQEEDYTPAGLTLQRRCAATNKLHEDFKTKRSGHANLKTKMKN